MKVLEVVALITNCNVIAIIRIMPPHLVPLSFCSFPSLRFTTPANRKEVNAHMIDSLLCLMCSMGRSHRLVDTYWALDWEFLA